MKQTCERCNPEVSYEIPVFSLQEKHELLQLKRQAPIRAVKLLIKRFAMSHSDAKFCVLHINVERGKCAQCDYHGLEAENEICSGCSAFNFNWKIT